MATQQPREHLLEPRFRVAAIDTSSDRAGVALFDGHDDSVIAWNANRNHTVDTLAQLDHLLRLSGWSLQQLDGIVVATGPGSFSALRVGLSIAKALAFSLQVPMIGIPTTDAIAGQFAWTTRPVLAVMRAGRGRVVWSHYAERRPLGAPNNTTLDELRARAVELDALIVSETELECGDDVLVLPAGARASQLARFGWEGLRAGERDDPARLEPIYAHGQSARKPMPA